MTTGTCHKDRDLFPFFFLLISIHIYWNAQILSDLSHESFDKCMHVCNPHLQSTEHSHCSRKILPAHSPPVSPICPPPLSNHRFDFYHHRLVWLVLEFHINGIYSVYSFGPGFFCSASWFWNSAMLLLIWYSFLLSGGIPLYEHTSPYLFFCLLTFVDICVVFTLGPLQMKL